MLWLEKYSYKDINKTGYIKVKIQIHCVDLLSYRRFWTYCLHLQVLQRTDERRETHNWHSTDAEGTTKMVAEKLRPS